MTRADRSSPDGAAKQAVHRRRFRAEVSRLAAIRRFVRQAARSLGAGDAAICAMALAVEEAVANTILHGYAGRPGHVEVLVDLQAGSLVVHLLDDAPPFDPTGVPRPDLSLPLHRRPIGGLGVYLMRRSVDCVVHRARSEGGNELTLTRRATDIKPGGPMAPRVVKVKCPRCGHSWEAALADLEPLEDVFLAQGPVSEDEEVRSYRATCPRDGTNIIINLSP